MLGEGAFTTVDLAERECGRERSKVPRVTVTNYQIGSLTALITMIKEAEATEATEATVATA